MAVGLHDAQPLQNFLTNSPWSVEDSRDRRLELTLLMLEGRSFKLVIDETGDKKKGKHTDYVAAKLGNLYGFRNWVEYAFKQGKNELGWADFRLTNYQQIEKWWELVMSAYFLVSLQAQARNKSESESKNETISPQISREPADFSNHIWWDFSLGWKSTLNNLRLIIQ
ncbi:MAG: hypothetical protein ACYTXJ_37185, partial [Nostoc sp.]